MQDHGTAAPEDAYGDSDNLTRVRMVQSPPQRPILPFVLDEASGVVVVGERLDDADLVSVLVRAARSGNEPVGMRWVEASHLLAGGGRVETGGASDARLPVVVGTLAMGRRWLDEPGLWPVGLPTSLVVADLSLRLRRLGEPVSIIEEPGAGPEPLAAPLVTARFRRVWGTFIGASEILPPRLPA